MDIENKPGRSLGWEFTDESYMNPDPNNIKYKGRDKEIGAQEAARRMAVFPILIDQSKSLIEELGIEPTTLEAKGSVAVGMCTPSSDFDIAVIVEPSHQFTRQPELWRLYQKKLIEVDGADFKIEPRLVVEDNKNLLPLSEEINKGIKFHIHSDFD